MKNKGFSSKKAIKSKLEREAVMEDIVDLKELRPQEKLALPFDEYLKKKKG